MEEFTQRIGREFQNVVELRLKDKSEAKEGHLKFVQDGHYHVEMYQYLIDNRKHWCASIVQRTLNEFTEYCSKLQESLLTAYDEKMKQFKDQYQFLKDTIVHRYGLAPLPSEDDMNEQLQRLCDEEGDCNGYIIGLKEKLLPPQDLERNLPFLEAYKDFQSQNELVSEMNGQLEEWEKKNEEDGGSNKYELDPLYMEISHQSKNQISVLMDEVRQVILAKDPILYILPDGDQIVNNRNNDSLQTILSPEALTQSGVQRTTFAQKLYEGSPYHDYEKSTPIKSKVQQTVEPVLTGEMSHVKQVLTNQGRGITCLQQIDQDVIACGSRDKTIAIINLNVANQNFQLNGHKDQVTAMCLFQGKLLVSGGGNLDSTLIIWSLQNRKAIHVLSGHQSGITSIIDLEDGQTLASSSYDNHAILWNATTGSAVCALRKHSAIVSCLLLSQRRDFLITGSWDKTIGIWQLQFDTARNVMGCKYVRDMPADGAVLCMKAFGDKQIVYGGTMNRVTVQDWTTGEVKRKLNTSQFGICELIVTQEFILGLGGSDGTLRLWKTASSSVDGEVKKDQANIQINLYNTSPKMADLTRGQVAIINNNDANPQFNIYQL